MSLFFVIILLAIILWPVKVVCGVPDATCTSGIINTKKQSYVTRYYEIEPVIVVLIEKITKTNFPFYYKKGYEKVYLD